MNKQFVAAINQLCIERNLAKEEVMEAISSAIRTAYRKDYGNKYQNIEVVIEEETGSIRVFVVREVVKKIGEEEGDNEIQILESEAKKLKKGVKVGEELRTDVTPESFGRIAAQAAKQVILQKISEKEREHMYEHFKERENELVNAQVHRVEGKNVYLEIEKNIVMLPRDEQISGENYYNGKRLKVYLHKVVKEGKGPRLLISRSHPALVKELFKTEIPEIKEGIVEIKGVARTSGLRTKIAVSSNDEKVDPVGACVGQKGVRIRSIINELSGEMIDIVPFDEDPIKFIKQAMSPAERKEIELDDEKAEATVYVEDEVRPQAIGKKGQNVYLAGELTGWRIEVKSLSEKVEGSASQEKVEVSEEMIKEGKVEDLPLTDSVKEKLIKAGIEDVSVLAQLSVDDLTQIGGIGGKTAEEIVEVLKQ